MIEETLLRIAVALEKLAGISPEREACNFLTTDDEKELAEERKALREQREKMLRELSPADREKWLKEQEEKWGKDYPWVQERRREILGTDVMPEKPAPVAETPKKRRGRPTKEEAAAKAAAMADAVVTDVSAGAGAAIAAALPVEQPKCADCGAVLTAENSSKLKTGAMFHVGCPKDAAPAPVELKIEKVREAALAFTAAQEKKAPGTGRQAFIDVLASMGVKVLADVPQPKWAELVGKLEVR